MEDTLTKHCRQPTPYQLADAQEILSNPAQFLEYRHRFPSYWEALKAARGETVNMSRLIPPSKPTLALRILARAKSLGRTRPQPLILNDATLPKVPNLATCS